MKLHSVGAELWYGDGQTWRSRQPLFAILWMLCLCGMYYWWLTDTPCWCCVCVDCTTGDWPTHQVDVVFVWTVLLVTDRHTRLMLCLFGLYYWWLAETPGWCCVCVDCTNGDWPTHLVDVVFVWTVLLVTDRHTRLTLSKLCLPVHTRNSLHHASCSPHNVKPINIDCYPYRLLSRAPIAVGNQSSTTSCTVLHSACCCPISTDL